MFVSTEWRRKNEREKERAHTHVRIRLTIIHVIDWNGNSWRKFCVLLPTHNFQEWMGKRRTSRILGIMYVCAALYCSLCYRRLFSRLPFLSYDKVEGNLIDFFYIVACCCCLLAENNNNNNTKRNNISRKSNSENDWEQLFLWAFFLVYYVLAVQCVFFLLILSCYFNLLFCCFLSSEG